MDVYERFSVTSNGTRVLDTHVTYHSAKPDPTPDGKPAKWRHTVMKPAGKRLQAFKRLNVRFTQTQRKKKDFSSLSPAQGESVNGADLYPYFSEETVRATTEWEDENETEASSEADGLGLALPLNDELCDLIEAAKPRNTHST